MTRIRYVSDSNGVLTSRPLVAGDKLVVLRLDTVNNRYSVLEGEHEVAYGTATDVAVLKKLAKETAKDLGVVFQDEVRRRNTTNEHKEVTQ